MLLQTSGGATADVSLGKTQALAVVNLRRRRCVVPGARGRERPWRARRVKADVYEDILGGGGGLRGGLGLRRAALCGGVGE